MWAMIICCPTARLHGILALSDAMLLQGLDFAQNHVNTLLVLNPLSMVKRYRLRTAPRSFKDQLLIAFTWIHPYKNLNPTITSITVGSQNNFSFLCPSVGNDRYVVVQDPLLVVCASHECLVCSFVVISNPWLLMRLKLPSITASPFFSASRTRLYKSMFFTLILSPSITTLRGTPFAALCITCFSSTKQYIFGLSPTNSVMRCPLCSSLKMGPGNSC